MITEDTLNRLRGVMVGAAAGDALGMPLEFGPATPLTGLVREMQPGRMEAGTFTDDTEMALALAESLLAHRPLDGDDLALRFAGWYRSNPPDIGVHTANVLRRVALGQHWSDAAADVQRRNPASASNGSIMRCWPAAVAWWNQPGWLAADSALQSRVTHPHAECVAGSVFINTVISLLIAGYAPQEAVQSALRQVEMPDGLRKAIQAAPGRERVELVNSGWVRHTLESAVWGLLTSFSFEEAVVRVANLGNDADTAACVAGALAGAAYGLESIPAQWQAALHGEYPRGSGQLWQVENLVQLADQLVGISKGEGSAAMTS